MMSQHQKLTKEKTAGNTVYYISILIIIGKEKKMLYGLILFGTAKNTEILSSVEGSYTLVLLTLRTFCQNRAGVIGMENPCLLSYENNYENILPNCSCLGFLQNNQHLGIAYSANHECLQDCFFPYSGAKGDVCL